MAWTTDKQAMRDVRAGASLKWDEITGVTVARWIDEAGRSNDGIAVEARSWDGCSQAYEIRSKEKGFAKVVRALGKNLPGLNADWYATTTKQLNGYRSFQVEVWWRDPPPEEEDIEDEEPEATEEELREWFDETGQKLSRKRKKSDRERTFVLVWELMNEIGNGGLSQYYGNPAGNAAVEAVEALVAIGAKTAATHLAKANRLFPGGEPSRSQPEREAQLDRMSGSALQKLDTLHEPGIYDKDDWLRLLHEWYEV